MGRNRLLINLGQEVYKWVTNPTKYFSIRTDFTTQSSCHFTNKITLDIKRYKNFKKSKIGFKDNSAQD